ncbi:MAG: ATP-binding protein [Burkholderiales bacterium]|nr:ATP-binding protein [Burkholderiales bacterium]
MPRLALLGGESSGKTSLALALAAALRTAWVPEYGRELWERVRHTLGVDELLQVARTQIDREEAALARLGPQPRGTWLVCDTTPLTTLQYCVYDHGSAPPALEAMARRPYDAIVVCEPDFDFVQDGARRDAAFRAAQHAWTLAQLHRFGMDWLSVGGSLARRLDAVIAHLQARVGRAADNQAPEQLHG